MTHIKRITSTSAELVDGRHVPLDIVICATGFDTSFHYPFDIIGRGGIKLNDRFKPHAESYLSLAVDGFPNLFTSFGPNSALNSSSFTVVLETIVNYVCAAVL